MLIGCSDEKETSDEELIEEVNCASDTIGSPIILEGIYNGKNVYVQNPFKSESQKGFCVERVSVNYDVTTETIQSSAFEIDFEDRGVKIGDSVIVVIEHSGCNAPKILNPEVLISSPE